MKSTKEMWYKIRIKRDWKKEIKYWKFSQRTLLRLPEPVLEAGCGSGAWIKFLESKNKQSVGMDYDQKTLQESHIKNLVAGNIIAVPIKSGTIGSYVSMGVLEHYTDSEIGKIFEEIKRILKKKGKVFILLPNPKAPWRIMRKHWNSKEKFAGIEERFDVDVETFAKKHGFKILEKGTCYFWYNFYAPIKYLLGKDNYAIKYIIMNLDFLGRLFKGRGTIIYYLLEKI